MSRHSTLLIKRLGRATVITLVLTRRSQLPRLSNRSDTFHICIHRHEDLGSLRPLRDERLAAKSSFKTLLDGMNPHAPGALDTHGDSQHYTLFILALGQRCLILCAHLPRGDEIEPSVLSLTARFLEYVQSLHPAMYASPFHQVKVIPLNPSLQAKQVPLLCVDYPEGLPSLISPCAVRENPNSSISSFSVLRELKGPSQTKGELSAQEPAGFSARSLPRNNAMTRRILFTHAPRFL
ncbi:hypothetical protein OF83DRAFT_1171266 [Amylostereum chailletii]|nr:hypothetical protein OF83DRAFT_1171266 [Amylostereum chailletii]